jgi:protein Mpv17
LDEFVMDPPQIAVFFGYMTACEGGTYPDFRQKMKQEFWNTWLTSLAVWPIVLLGTFRFLPLYAQAPVINACAIVWDGFLSYRNNAGRIMHEESNANAPLLSGSS